MNFRKAFLFLFLAPALLFSLESCNKCSDTGTITLGPENQFLTVTYLDTAGVNYLTNIYNPFGVGIMVNTKGGQGAYKPYSDDFTDGKFGPIPFTHLPVSPSAVAKFGVPYDYYFVFLKDTFKADTFRIQFYANQDECKAYWAQIKFYKNGQELVEFDGLETCELVITE